MFALRALCELIIRSTHPLDSLVSILSLIHQRLCENAKVLHLVSSVGLLNWTSLELATAIVCACVPTYGPIFSHSWEIPFIKSWYAYSVSIFRSSRDAKIQSPPFTGAKRGGSYRNTSHWYNIDDSTTEQRPLTCPPSRAKLSERSLNHESFILPEIQVQDKIEEV